ncbi:MAG: hypothetical protein DMF91_28040 [Acidobacteria bacterium]|nr:MAG: hypothetical protein DMF91_28040 [Acidobacteriota bacterium]
MHPLYLRVHDRAGVCAQPRRHHHRDVSDGDRCPPHADDGGQSPRAPGTVLGLRAAGYYTTNRAKTDYQFGVPFTVWDDLGRNAHWRNRPDKNQPFFAVFNLEVTHESQVFPSSPARKGKQLVTDPAVLQVPPYYPDTPAVREELARMYDNIADMDGQVGELLKQLEDDGLADNTIVFYWSDHGDGVPRAKRSLYDSGLRVPLMIRWPKALGSDVTPRQLRRSRADGARAGRRGDPDASPGTRARRSRRRGGAGVRVRGARPDGYRVRHDALRPRRPIPLHPQLRTRAAVRRPHHLSQSERHHAGVAPAAGRKEADGARGTLDANTASGGGAVRHAGRSSSDPESVRGAGTSRNPGAHAQRRDGLDGARR